MSNQRSRWAPHAAAYVHHQLGQRKGIVSGLHESPVTHFNVQNDNMGTCGDLFAHDTSGDQGQTVYSGGHVTQSIKFLSAGTRLPVWAIIASRSYSP